MGFKLPQLDTCCCGCTLRTGALILLWLYVILNVLSIALPPLAPQGSGAGNATKVESGTPLPSSEINWSDQISPFGVWSVIVNAIGLVVGSVGLYGVYRELHLHLLPYLTWTLVQFSITVVGELARNFSVGTIIGEIVGILIFFYFWLVVFSHFRVLKGSVRPIQA